MSSSSLSSTLKKRIPNSLNGWPGHFDFSNGLGTSACCIDLSFSPPQFLTALGIFQDNVSGYIAQEMPYLQLLLLRRVQEKFSFMMVEEIISHFIFLTNSMYRLLLK